MNPKESAIQALTAARKSLDMPEPMVGLRLQLLRGTIDFALEEIAKVQEVKRKRKGTVA